MIGIIGAMEEEVAELKKDMQIEETVEMAGMVFCKGTLGGKDVVIVRSGIGKVNAGICAQILADVFQVDALINTGIAGSLNNDINIGDIVLSIGKSSGSAKATHNGTAFTVDTACDLLAINWTVPFLQSMSGFENSNLKIPVMFCQFICGENTSRSRSNDNYIILHILYHTFLSSVVNTALTTLYLHHSHITLAKHPPQTLQHLSIRMYIAVGR